MLNHPRGLSLLLSLFVLSAILVASLSAGVLILRELKFTGAGDRGIQAFYVAESALEDALYEFRQNGNTELTVDEASPNAMSNGDWWRSSSQTINNISTTVLENEVIEVALFDPDNSSSQALSVRLSWVSQPTVCPGADFTWLEVVHSYWLVEPISERILLSPSNSVGSIINMSGSYPYIRLRALFGDACGLALTAYDGANGSGSTFALPAQLQVTATGEVVDARQSLSITVPARAAQFGAFDYTLFSEEPLCKGVSPCN
jgi:hypothetical protein